jgi:hypothetical protein
MEVILAFVVPTAIFGAFALLAMWLGAESRPWFDERPVLDDRPNWFPIARWIPRDDEDDDDEDDDEDDEEPRGGTPQPVASETSAATSPSGVWSPASSAAT